MTRRLSRIAATILVLGVLVAAIPAARSGALRMIGGALVINEPLVPVDIAVMTESGEAGELELSDLYRERVMPRVMVLTPAPSSAERELQRRGVHREDFVVTTLVALGVPREAIITVEAGEGGTTESTEALATWAADHPCRVLVVVSPTHARRYRRTLQRIWPQHVPAAVIRYPRANPFHTDDWWEARRTRREGLFELQKLVWDYLRHPW